MHDSWCTPHARSAMQRVLITFSENRAKRRMALYQLYNSKTLFFFFFFVFLFYTFTFFLLFVGCPISLFVVLGHRNGEEEGKCHGEKERLSSKQIVLSVTRLQIYIYISLSEGSSSHCCSGRPISFLNILIYIHILLFLILVFVFCCYCHLVFAVC